MGTNFLKRWLNSVLVTVLGPISNIINQVPTKEQNKNLRQSPLGRRSFWKKKLRLSDSTRKKLLPQFRRKTKIQPSPSRISARFR